MSATVTVEAQGRENGGAVQNTLPMAFALKKEPGHRFLIIPTERWRVVRVEGSGLENLGGGLLDF